MNKVQEAREKYRPERVKLIFLAEAPPCKEGHFFYFEDVPKGDSLFLHVIRAVFPDLEKIDTKELRKRKEEMLFRFAEAGYFLEESVSVAIPKGTKNKEAVILEHQADLLNRLDRYKANTKFVLLSSGVFKVNYETMKSKGFNILNDFMIPFPGSGQQGKFKEGISNLNLKA
ncbi:MAG: hypothetical protein JXR60_04365 [Bacteroidales bacterium]|nr:hypothetical protein [Bacteroidales bacterium]